MRTEDTLRPRLKVHIGLLSLLSPGMVGLQAQPATPSNLWIASGDLKVARSGACSVLLSDGRVMIAGGTAAEGPVRTVELYGPFGVFRIVTPMLQKRTEAACTRLADG